MLVLGNGKDGRISIKDVRRCGACELCKSRKRKCDGQEPCSYCVSKNWTCTYAQQKKRGPPKKYAILPTNGTQLNSQFKVQIVSPSTSDCELSDKLEALNLGDMYLKYVNAKLPTTSRDKMLTPANSSHKVQAYAALAYTARVCGDLNKANKYISQARLLAGDIYDLANPDSVSAMLMICFYWQLVYNLPQSSHYARMVTSLRKMLAAKNSTGIDFRVNLMCEFNAIISDDTTTNQTKAELMRETANLLLSTSNAKKEFITLMTSVLTLGSYVLEFLNYNPMSAQVASVQEFYGYFDNVHVSEAQRLLVLEAANRYSVVYTLQKNQATVFASDSTNYTIFKPMFMTIIEWRSGHIQEALTFAITAIQNIQALANVDYLSFTCGMLDYFIIGMMGGVCRFLLSIGQNALAVQMNTKIIEIAKLLSPEFDFLLEFAKEFDTWIPAIDQPPIITLLDEENTSTTNSNINTYNDTKNFNTSINSSPYINSAPISPSSQHHYSPSNVLPNSPPFSNYTTSIPFSFTSTNFSSPIPSSIPIPQLTDSPKFSPNFSPNFASPSPIFNLPAEIPVYTSSSSFPPIFSATNTTTTHQINHNQNTTDSMPNNISNSLNTDTLTLIPIQTIADLNNENINTLVEGIDDFLAELT